MAAKLTRAERETGILWNDEDDTAVVWTSSPTGLRKLTRRLGEPSHIGSNGAAQWTIPKKQITIRGKSRKRKPPQSNPSSATPF